VPGERGLQGRALGDVGIDDPQTRPRRKLRAGVAGNAGDLVSTPQCLLKQLAAGASGGPDNGDFYAGLLVERA
jgi:hypothetical protein